MPNAKVTRRHCLKNVAVLGLSATGAALLPQRARAADDKSPRVLDIGSRLELFVDDDLVEKSSRLSRRNAVLTSGSVPPSQH